MVVVVVVIVVIVVVNVAPCSPLVGCSSELSQLPLLWASAGVVGCGRRSWVVSRSRRLLLDQLWTR